MRFRRHIYHVIYKSGSDIDLLFLWFNRWRKITLKPLFRKHSDYPKFLFVSAIKLKNYRKSKGTQNWKEFSFVSTTSEKER